MNMLDDTLRLTAEETFESLAFMFPTPPEEAAPTDGPMTSAAVEFAGPFAGVLLLSIEEAMAAELVGNMLGVMDPDELTAEQQCDGFGELLNVICGNLLPRLAGEEAVFDVRSPHLLTEADPVAAGDGLIRRASVTLDLDSGRAEVVLFTDVEIDVAVAG